MKQGTTTFLKLVIFLMGAAVFALCVFALPTISRELGRSSQFAVFQYPVLIGGYLTAIPFYVALYQGLKLLSYIDKNNAFSNLSVKALKTIKYCAAMISVVYAVSLPFFYHVADYTDAPGIMVIGLIVTFAPVVIAVFAAVLERVLKNAIEIKSENDLTI